MADAHISRNVVAKLGHAIEGHCARELLNCSGPHPTGMHDHFFRRQDDASCDRLDRAIAIQTDSARTYSLRGMRHKMLSRFGSVDPFAGAGGLA